MIVNLFRLAGPLLALIITLQAGAQVARTDATRFLEAHNFYRAQAGTPPLAWSNKLAQRAEEWAVLLIKQDRYAPRRDGIFGENLYEITGGFSSPGDVVTAWAGEAKNFNRKTNGCSARCGHYTQVVWRDTKTVGCGVARDNRREIWVCNYDPPGNVIGERPY